LLVPAARIPEVDVPDNNVPATPEINILRAYGLIWTVIFQRILNHPLVNHVNKVSGYLESLAVNNPLAGYSDVFLVKRKDQGGPVEIPVIIKGVHRSHKDGSLLKVDGHI